MATPRTPNQKKQYAKLNARLKKYGLLVDRLYDKYNREAAKIALRTGYDPDADEMFHFQDFPQTREAIRELLNEYVSDITGTINRSTSQEWQNSNEFQDLVANKVLKAYGVIAKDGTEYKRYFQANSDHLKAFQTRTVNGMNLSKRVWNLREQYKQELEMGLSVGIEKGTSAASLAKQLKQYLKEPDKLFRRVRDKFGNLELSKNAKAYHPGRGIYRSSYKNALRLTRSESNMAYRTAEQTRWKQFDFVVGYEIKTTQNGMHREDVCDMLTGRYPKEFVWTGWHPMCYSDDSEVLTNQGWKLLKDVDNSDLILSLNPDTLAVGWVGIVDQQSYEINGEMLRFYNKSLDCLVTPEHRMVYLNKNDGRIKYCQAKDFTKGKGAFYRGAKYFACDKSRFTFEDREVSFDDFCEFMGYYLSDGSLQHGTGVIIAQRNDQSAFDSILAVAKRMGYNPKVCKDTIAVYNSALNRYLSQFGRCIDKFIPTEIKSASKRQICIFLNAFIKCDGYCRNTKMFVGNHGNVFRSNKDERLYFTTSERLAGDLSELILKIGHRPSFYVLEPTPHFRKDGIIIKGNHRCYRISECYSTTATVFKKEKVNYSGKVYDLTLEKNHIMYIRRNGKCFWGSNCMCYCVSILKTEDEFWRDLGEDEPGESENEVTDVPDAFKDWIRDNEDRIEAAERRGTQPYFIQDNKDYVEEVLDDKSGYKSVFSSDNAPLAPSKILDVSEIQNKISQLAEENTSWFKRGYYGIEARATANGGYMSTTLDGKIRINFATDANGFNAGESLVSAIRKIGTKEALNNHEEYSLEVLWHEILHNKSDNTAILPPINSPLGFTRTVAETINQLVARHSYPSFVAKLGGKAINQKWVLDNGYGYSATVNNTRSLLSKAGINESQFVSKAEKILMKDYTDIDVKISELLSNEFRKVKGTGDIGLLFSFIERWDFGEQLKVFNKR
ncbi:MAG: hypothetical protein NC548_38205 [Lachnospiraceae bacterium]|nr:hypothetical protein [Lachnospiraceae bacterium]